MFIYDLSIFLTSTAFVSTKAKYGIPLSRYTAFLKTVLAVLNINNPEYAMVLSLEGKLLETNMEPVEQAFVMRIWEKNSSLMEEDNA